MHGRSIILGASTSKDKASGVTISKQFDFTVLPQIRGVQRRRIILGACTNKDEVASSITISKLFDSTVLPQIRDMQRRSIILGACTNTNEASGVTISKPFFPSVLTTLSAYANKDACTNKDARITKAKLFDSTVLPQIRDMQRRSIVLGACTKMDKASSVTISKQLDFTVLPQSEGHVGTV